MMFGLFSRKRPMDKMVEELIGEYGKLCNLIMRIDNNFYKLYEAGIYVGSIAVIPIGSMTTPYNKNLFCNEWVKRVAASYEINGREVPFDTVFKEFQMGLKVYAPHVMAYMNEDETFSVTGEMLLKKCNINIPEATDIAYMDDFVPFLTGLLSITVDTLSISHKFATKL